MQERLRRCLAMRTPLPPVAVVLSFIDRINRSDLSGLLELMTGDHQLIFPGEAPIEGRAANERAWRGYMASFPHYVIHPGRLVSTGDRVAVLGATTGSHLALPDDEELKLTLIWLATVRAGKLAVWELRDDTPAQRSEWRLS